MAFYKFSGTSSDAGYVHILQDHVYIGYEIISVGDYQVIFESSTSSGVTAVAQKTNGKVLGYGEITCAVDGGDESIVRFHPGQLPLSGQTTSYATGDDGDLEIGMTANSELVTISGGEVIKDWHTGLMWVADPESAGCNNGTSQNWADALSFCNSLTFAAYSDWRMPNIKEALSTVRWQPDGYGFYIDSSLYGYLGGGSRFPDRTDFWTSTTKYSSTTYAWIVNVDSLIVNSSYAKSVALPIVRPVRAM